MIEENNAGLADTPIQSNRNAEDAEPRRSSRSTCFGTCCRHFKVLMRKNMIMWWRTPICSAVEMLAPVLLMAILTLIRLQVPLKNVDKQDMLNN